MIINEKEAGLIDAGKLKAVIRKERVKENVGDIAFEAKGVPYMIVEKKHWTLRRINAQRGTRDFSCKSAYHFKIMYQNVYGEKYDGRSKDLYWMILVEGDEKQRTLEEVFIR